MVATGFECAKHTEVSMAAALLWETGDHIACSAVAHLLWKWLHWRRFTDRKWKWQFVEGYAISIFLSVVVGALALPFHKEIYANDPANTDPAAAYAVIIAQHAIVSVLWFSALLAILYFERSKQLEIQRAEAVTAARESQLHALKGQLNPHFLFNSFNSLRALIDENPALAREAITHLAVILRYSLTSAERKFVPLSEELRVTHLYLELEKLRLGPRLTVTMQIEPGLEAILIPPLMLQGLVENAVKFGPAARKIGGEIVCSARQQNGQFHLRVTNPGHLNAASESTGIGLKNLRERLRLLHGDAASLSLAEEGERVVADVRLPLDAQPTTIPHG